MNRDMNLRLVIRADGTAAVTVVKQATSGVDGLSEAQKRAAGATRQTTDSAAAYIAELKKQAAALTMTSQAFREMEAKSRGATEAQLAEVRTLGKQIDELTRNAQRFSSAAGNVSSMLLGWVAPAAILVTLHQMVGTLTEARLQVEKLNATQLFANAGDVQAAARDIEFVKQRANALGVEFLVVSNAWGKFNAAARGSSLAGNAARDVFDALLKASTALRLSGPETEGALLAVQQMMSKGNVQAEELRGQLGERLPGAFGIAARAMGVTERELNKMLETGQVLASDFLPKFGAQLTKELGDAPQRAAEGTQATLNRLSNAFVGFKQEASQVSDAGSGISLLTNLFNGLAEKIRLARADGAGLWVVLDRLIKLSSNGGIGADLLYGDDEGKKRARAQKLGEEISYLAQQQAKTLNDTTKQQYQAGIEIRKAALLKMYEVETLIDQSERDSLQRRAENAGAVGAMLDARKAADERFLKARAEAGDKTAKLNLAYKEIDEKFAKDLASGTRTIEEINKLRATEYKKIYGGGDKAAADAVYKEFIATQERLQAAINQSVKDETEALKRGREAGLVNERDYVDRLHAINMIAQAEREESVRQELAAAQKRVAAGDQTKKADVAKYLAEVKEFGNQRKKIEGDTEDAIARIRREAIAKELADFERRRDNLAQYVEGTNALKRQMAEDLEDRQFELSLLGLSEQQQQRLQALRQVELTQRRALAAAYREYIAAMDRSMSAEEDAELTRLYNERVAKIKAGTDAQREATTVLVEQGQRINEQKEFWGGLFNSIKGGWKGVRDYVKNYFFDWLIKQLTQRWVMNIAVGSSGGGGAGAGGIMDILGSIFGGGGASGGSSSGGIGGILSSVLGSGGAGGLIGSVLGIGTGGGLLGAVGLGGFGMGLGGVGSLAGSTALSLGLPGAALGAQLANFIPVIGPLIAVALTLLPGLLKNKSGLWFDINGQTPGGGRSYNQFTTALGTTIQMHGEADIKDIKPFVAQFQNLAQNFVDVFGKEIADKASLAANAFWTGYSERGRGTEYENNQQYAAALATESKDVMAEYFSRVFSVVNAKIAETISTWEGTTEELVKYIQGVLAVQMSLKQQAPLLKAIIGESIDLNQVVELQREGENLSDTFARLLNTFSVTNQIAQTMGKGLDAFGAVGLASLEARERLVALAGGLQALSADVTFYLEQFFTDAERRSMQVQLATQQLAAGFGDLGLAVPTTREEFRRMIDGLDLSTDAGARLYAALIKLAPALDLVLDAAEASGAPRKGRLAVDNTARDEFDRALDAYMQAMYTAEERLAMRRADLNRQITDTFNRLGIAVPASIEQFRELVNSIDRSTPAGQAMYEMLVRLAPAFAELANMAQQIVGGVWAGDVSAAAGAAIQGTWENLVAIIEAGSESLQVQLQRKLAAAQSLASSAQAAYLDAARRGVSGPALEQLRLQALAAQQIYQQIGANMALFVSLQAQYGDRAADMFELEQWYQQQRAAAGDNAALLLMIEQSYQARRTQILTEGTSQGLSQLRATIKAWIDNLLLNNQLTTLTPEQQLSEARRQYEAALQSGDASAITRAADAYLQQARSFYASGSQYAAIFAAVLAQMQALAAGQNVPVVPTPQVPIVPTATAPGMQAAANRRAFDAESNAAAALSLARDALEAVASLTAENTRAIKDEASLSREAASRDAERLANKMAGVGQQRVPV